jgi:hypothetical protein
MMQRSVTVDNGTEKQHGYDDFLEVCRALDWSVAPGDSLETSDYFITHRSPTWRGWSDVTSKVVEMNHHRLVGMRFWQKYTPTVSVVEVDDECYT